MSHDRPVRSQDVPSAVESEDELEELLSRPSSADIAFMAGLPGDVAVLGAGGKMGPTLARRVRRAADAAARPRRVVAVSRFSSPDARRALESAGIDTVACDLLDPDAVGRLPPFENVLFLAGMKFGATERPDLTWAMNTIVPANVARRYAGSRTVVFSTGNVYPLVPREIGGCRESNSTAPVGEYAQSCLGRERIFEYYSAEKQTPAVLLRLFYAVDLRYGVLVDVARRVLAGEAIDLTVGYANVLWQGDAHSFALRSLGLATSPPLPLNVTGPEIVSIRDVAEQFGRRFGRSPLYSGSEGPTALLADTSLCRSLLGEPQVSLDVLVGWVASWVEKGGRLLGKPTKYERSDGRF